MIDRENSLLKCMILLQSHDRETKSHSLVEINMPSMTLKSLMSRKFLCYG
jgi:hypothetical protein